MTAASSARLTVACALLAAATDGTIMPGRDGRIAQTPSLESEHTLMITDSPGVRLRESVVAQVMDGQMVLLDVNGGQYYDLNASGTLMLERLLAGATREQVIAAVEDKFLASSERVAADLDALVLTLRQAGLIEG